MAIRRVVHHFFILLISLLFFACGGDSQRFQSLRSRDTGIDFINKLSPTADLNILSYLYYYNGAGVSAGDFNGDGLPDLYFVGNQSSDRLYLNKGDLKFQEVTNKCGISNEEGWSFGVTHVDVNSDGLLDIYVCKVGNYRSIEGQNLLFVNQGNNEEGVPQFKEMAPAYGLDVVGFSTQSAFFDFDLDGDLDMFLLNHSVHPNRSYGKGRKRKDYDAWSGDRFFRNENGVFQDVSKEVGIFQGSIGYGLGLSIGDLNNDGYPDVYVGNDFFENDYLYINQNGETFFDINSTSPELLGHTSHFSMGNAFLDVNNDGWQDIISLDMLPQNLATYKTSGHEDPFSIYEYFLKNGYNPQYMQNTLHLNLGDNSFSEIGHFAGLSATEWSWSVLAEDFDLDGLQDIYITNGIIGATNDMDFISFIAQDKVQKALLDGNSESALNFTKELPEKKVTNFAFRNLGDGEFENISDIWFQAEPSFSAGAVAVDLDLDGDLEIVINNTSEEATVYENTAGGNYLKLNFRGPAKNPFGIGVKVEVYLQDKLLAKENFLSGSYLSSAMPELVFGLGNMSIDSVIAYWPGGGFQKFFSVMPNQKITVRYEEAVFGRAKNDISNEVLTKDSTMNITFAHREERTLEYDRDALTPYSKGHEGPKASVADINDDGRQDLYIGGAKRQRGMLFIQNAEGEFVAQQLDGYEEDSLAEETDNLFMDVDGDGDLDLIVGVGGNEFRGGKNLNPRLYINTNGSLSKRDGAFDEVSLHAGVIKSLDLENDGDMDLIIGSNTVAWEFGASGRNVILSNDGNGNFKDVTNAIAEGFQALGLVEDIAIIDLDNNGFDDFIAIGHWFPVAIYMNNGESFFRRETNLDYTEGWWNTIEVADFDKDGDVDIVAGNWGLNTRLTATEREPITLYRNDFDDNGRVDPVVTYYYQGQETTLASKDELVKQIPKLNKNFLSYQSFAEASIEELFGSQKLKNADRKYVYELASSYFENTGDGNFIKRQLPREVQFSSVHDIEVDDFDGDGFVDLLVVGNSYEISTQLGRLDASHGLLLLNNQSGFFKTAKPTLNVVGAARDIEKVLIGDQVFYLVTINNNKPVFLTRENVE